MTQTNSQPDDSKVSYFFVGVGKCGTSWLYEFFKRHNLISVPLLKEPYLIGKPPEDQTAIIEKLYDSRNDMADFSTLYYWDPENAQQIYEYNPNARVLITIRMPSERIVSHFHFLRRSGMVQEETIAEYLESGDREDIVKRSSYREMIQRYTDVFGPKQIILLPLEQLNRSPQLYVDRLCDFLGVPRVSLDEEDLKPVLQKARARSMVLSRIAKFSPTTLRKLGLLTLLGRLKASTMLRAILFKDVTTKEEVVWGARKHEIDEMDSDYALLLKENDISL